MNPNKLNTSLEFIKGIGKIRSKLIRDELKINTCQQMLYSFPFRYIDRSKFFKISEIKNEMIHVQIKGVFKDLKLVKFSNKYRLEGKLYDGYNYMTINWFKGLNWVEKSIELNKEYVLFGRLSWFNNKPNMVHPEFERMNSIVKKGFVKIKPVYHSTEKLINHGITNNFFIKIIKNIFSFVEDELNENLNKEINEKYNFYSTRKSLINIHFPKDFNHLEIAKKKIIFEEFFFNQLRFNLVKINRKRINPGYYFPSISNKFKTFYDSKLNFDLTNSQKKVLKEIREDFSSKKQMNRLLQGDVGSGKTIVAIMSVIIAVENNFQSCIVAPTEILAQQHFSSFINYLSDININVKILTGSTTKLQRNLILSDLIIGEIDVLIGTHALFEDDVRFKNLGYVVIDEQHKFGVKQRSKMWKKNNPPPHVLIMTATPIPRTLTMSIYGDLDISIIDEMPPGRKDIVTVHRKDSNRLKVFAFLKDQIKSGRQVYIVYPLIEESKKMDLKFLEDGYESLLRDFPRDKYQIGVLHGKMKNNDKDYEMKRFIVGKTNILISTTVIEVGVNVPNASVMIIESAERFGLSQMHQLRGRVGRGSYESYCILMTKDNLSNDAQTRINAMTETNNGFKISEIDLKLRGPGDVLGTRQSGDLDFKLGDIVNDVDVFNEAFDEVKKVISSDPDLINISNNNIKSYLVNNSNNKSWNIIG